MKVEKWTTNNSLGKFTAFTHIYMVGQQIITHIMSCTCVKCPKLGHSFRFKSNLQHYLKIQNHIWQQYPFFPPIFKNMTCEDC